MLSTLQDQTLFQPIPVLNDQGGSVMDMSCDITETLRAQEHGHQPIIFDARGNGDGKIVPTITGDHENRITDYTGYCNRAPRPSTNGLSAATKKAKNAQP